MIEHLALLRHIGQFDNDSPNRQTSLGALALIYGENGRGKTTLASILRSLANNDPVPIAERRRLGSPDAPHIVIKTTTQTHTFQHNTWNFASSNIAVFDDTFITTNVYSGTSVDAGHKQSLHELIIGATGIRLYKELQTHIEANEQHIQNLRQKETSIPTSIRGPYTVDAFCAIEPDGNLNEKLRKPSAHSLRHRRRQQLASNQPYPPSLSPASTLTQRDGYSRKASATSRQKPRQEYASTSRHSEKLAKHG